MFVPSKYQADFANAMEETTTDIMLVAVAGSGKTSTIVRQTKRIPIATRQKTLLTAFNKHIQEELKARQDRGDIPKDIQISTIHGLGYQVLRNHFHPKNGKGWVDDTKYRKLTDIFFRDAIPYEDWNTDECREAKDAARELVRLCMISLSDPRDPRTIDALSAKFGVEMPNGRYGDIILKAIPQILEWGSKGLPRRDDKTGKKWSPEEAISFDDMIYLPIALNLTIPTFDLCFIDEAQDFNRCQQELLIRAKGDGRAIWVGDPSQAIYGFTGADERSFQTIQERTGAVRMPLSICYRCSKAVIRKAKQFVPEIEEWDQAPEGVVANLTVDQIVELAIGHYRNAVTRHDPFMILCRINAPLITLAFKLISQGIPAKVRGRDIGASMVKTCDEIEKLKGFNFDEFVEFAEWYRRVKIDVLSRKEGTEMTIASMNDRIDSILCVYESARVQGASSIADLRSHIADLFSDETTSLMLSTIHGAKGLEARFVGIIRPDLLPHPKAGPGWQTDQERNLTYVAITRAKENCLIGGTLGWDLEKPNGND